MNLKRCHLTTSALWRACAALGVVFGALLLSACGEPARSPLAVGVNAWVGNDPLVLARDRDLVDHDRIKVVELASGAEVQRSLRNGLIDAAAITLDEALRLRAQAVDVRVIALLDVSHGADVVVAHPSIASPAALRGARIAVEDSTVGALLLLRMLQTAGLGRADVQVVNMEAGLHGSALRDGRVAAAVSYAPVSGPMLEAGFVRLFDSSQIPGEIIDVLVVTEAALTQRPADVDAILQAWLAGLRALQSDPAAAARVLSLGTDLNPQEYLDVLGGLQFLSLTDSHDHLRGSPTRIDGQVRAVSAALVEMGLLDRAPDWTRMVDVKPLERVLAAESKGREP